MNYAHVWGIVLRNFYLFRRSWYRILGLFYWTIMELLLWGFVTLWLNSIQPQGAAVNFTVTLLGALIFWDLFIRAQQSISTSFLEDVWSRNLMNIFITPMKSSEFVLGFTLISLIQGIVSFIFVSILAFFLYSLKIWAFGFYIIPFFLNIFIFGWVLGFLTVGMILRFGPSFEVLVWSLPFLFEPFSAIFYPISILPMPLQQVAFFLPTSHLFEGMRMVILTGTFSWSYVFWATFFNLIYFALAVFFLYSMLKAARTKGLISRLLTD